jgi:hypothetical protein
VFLAELVDDPQVQAAVRRRIVKGDTTAFFRALDQVIGRAKESVGIGRYPVAAPPRCTPIGTHSTYNK